MFALDRVILYYRTIRLAITKQLFFQTCFGWIVEYWKHLCLLVVFWYKSIHTPLLYVLIKICRNGIFSLLYSIANWIASLIELIMSNNGCSCFSFILWNFTIAQKPTWVFYKKFKFTSQFNFPNITKVELKVFHCKSCIVGANIAAMAAPLVSF